MKLTKLYSILPAIIIGFLLTSSCTRYKNLIYLQEEGTEKERYTAVPPDYKIQKRDVLFIRILSLNQEVTQVINATSAQTQNLPTNEAGLFIYGYNVSDSGYVEIPIIGKILVEGLTIERAKIAIEKQTSVFLKDATVIIKLVSFKYSVIGEVGKPGVYQNFNNQLTVLEAISNAGDITEFGDRRQVMVIRPGAEGTETFRIDLTDPGILDSEGFFLLPNDIVYVEPVRSYNFRVNIPALSLLLTSISTLILILNFVNTN
jgi:polysaccharide export outer membrane protein